MVLAAQLERVEMIQMIYEKCCPMIHPLTGKLIFDLKV